MISVTDKTFEQEVLDFEGTVFVDFWAAGVAHAKLCYLSTKNFQMSLLQKT